MGSPEKRKKTVLSFFAATRGRIYLCFAAVTLLCGGCSSIPSPEQRYLLATDLAAQHGWRPQLLNAGPFNLMAFVPKAAVHADSLTIYIEGDGFAWATSSQASLDPTPRTPLALQLALAHPIGRSVAYLGRPCQYVGVQAAQCEERYWTVARFAPEVIAASDKAIDILKRQAGAQNLTLVGYSGGAAVAALVAAIRSDVKLLVTVAGNLDHRAWTSFHRLTPLEGSLNPADFRDGLAAIAQVHLVGDRDTVIPRHLTERFVQGLPGGSRVRVLAMPGYDHHCCWTESWKKITPTIEAGQFTSITFPAGGR